MNFVDQRLIVPKFWRDVYHYTKKGQLTGWTRYSEFGKTEFNKDGLMVLGRDSLGRCITGQTVEYVRTKPEQTKKNKRSPRFNTNPLQYKAGREIWHYRYKDDADFQGKVVQIEKR